VNGLVGLAEAWLQKLCLVGLEDLPLVGLGDLCLGGLEDLITACLAAQWCVAGRDAKCERQDEPVDGLDNDFMLLLMTHLLVVTQP